ncbi:MAG: alpha-amylase, partial [Candidatus Izimaplasma sp.]|nr:alpha-amylase [Candidatus Izimaplasma bacterium]
ITKDKIFSYGNYEIIITDKEVYYGEYQLNNKHIVGIFNVGQVTGNIEVNIKDGIYQNLLDDRQVKIKDKSLELSEGPLLFWVKK